MPSISRGEAEIDFLSVGDQHGQHVFVQLRAEIGENRHIKRPLQRHDKGGIAPEGLACVSDDLMGGDGHR